MAALEPPPLFTAVQDPPNPPTQDLSKYWTAVYGKEARRISTERLEDMPEELGNSEGAELSIMLPGLKILASILVQKAKASQAIQSMNM